MHIQAEGVRWSDLDGILAATLQTPQRRHHRGFRHHQTTVRCEARGKGGCGRATARAHSHPPASAISLSCAMIMSSALRGCRSARNSRTNACAADGSSTPGSARALKARSTSRSPTSPMLAVHAQRPSSEKRERSFARHGLPGSPHRPAHRRTRVQAAGRDSGLKSAVFGFPLSGSSRRRG